LDVGTMNFVQTLFAVILVLSVVVGIS
jgi:hypothetical protein